jgi:hypothetical protein
MFIEFALNVAAISDNWVAYDLQLCPDPLHGNQFMSMLVYPAASALLYEGTKFGSSTAADDSLREALTESFGVCSLGNEHCGIDGMDEIDETVRRSDDSRKKEKMAKLEHGWQKKIPLE